ncbi:hypothetical protein ElyMa_002454700 [Elysia marginata]|uniref:Secreted protein n=1 Tax=Elysia marginata TaxID=1093978 RepID=A0AAV4GMY1_9GAST|nr:hypothetical protein ElyMa_002454700 [Elysia marginata]
MILIAIWRGRYSVVILSAVKLGVSSCPPTSASPRPSDSACPACTGLPTAIDYWTPCSHCREGQSDHPTEHKMTIACWRLLASCVQTPANWEVESKCFLGWNSSSY